MSELIPNAASDRKAAQIKQQRCLLPPAGRGLHYSNKHVKGLSGLSLKCSHSSEQRRLSQWVFTACFHGAENYLDLLVTSGGEDEDSVIFSRLSTLTGEDRSD